MGRFIQMLYAHCSRVTFQPNPRRTNSHYYTWVLLYVQVEKNTTFHYKPPFLFAIRCLHFNLIYCLSESSFFKFQ